MDSLPPNMYHLLQIIKEQPSTWLYDAKELSNFEQSFHWHIKKCKHYSATSRAQFVYHLFLYLKSNTIMINTIIDQCFGLRSFWDDSVAVASLLWSWKSNHLTVGTAKGMLKQVWKYGRTNGIAAEEAWRVYRKIFPHAMPTMLEVSQNHSMDITDSHIATEVLELPPLRNSSSPTRSSPSPLLEKRSQSNLETFHEKRRLESDFEKRARRMLTPSPQMKKQSSTPTHSRLLNPQTYALRNRDSLDVPSIPNTQKQNETNLSNKENKKSVRFSLEEETIHATKKSESATLYRSQEDVSMEYRPSDAKASSLPSFHDVQRRLQELKAFTLDSSSICHQKLVIHYPHGKKPLKHSQERTEVCSLLEAVYRTVGQQTPLKEAIPQQENEKLKIPPRYSMKISTYLNNSSSRDSTQ